MRILINDSHPKAKAQWSALLEKPFPAAVLEWVKDDQPILENVFYHPWDLLVFFPDTLGMEGFELLKEIKKQKPQLPVLVISDLAPELVALRSIKSGASSFLTRENLATDLVPALEHLLAGKKYINNRTAELIAASLESDVHGLPHNALSEREDKVFRLIVRGHSIAAIGEQLQLSNNTINTYRTRILDKLNLANNQELEQYARLYKLMD